ncbi:MAG TPA: hypothetical protein PKD61_15610 [Polyangiaceae bacterium]|nr:hypothetical protein [Polyangiaceae bacterium]
MAIGALVVTACSPANQSSQGPGPHPAQQADDDVSKRESPSDNTSSGSGSDAPGFTVEEAREICATIIRKTRSCKELYLPALLRTRAKYDQPPGIAARYKADGESELLPIASKEFDHDFSDLGISERCGALLAKPKANRDAILASERTCLREAENCPEFVACNVALLERKWGAGTITPPQGE